jgi:hypothetical protein
MCFRCSAYTGTFRSALFLRAVQCCTAKWIALYATASQMCVYISAVNSISIISINSRQPLCQTWHIGRS